MVATLILRKVVLVKTSFAMCFISVNKGAATLRSLGLSRKQHKDKTKGCTTHMAQNYMSM